MNIVNLEVENFINDNLNYFSGKLGALQKNAYEEGFPVIKKATARFLATILTVKKPEKILEIGCCIGFSASLMAEYMPSGGHITTIDRYDLMIDRAKKTFKDMDLEDRVTLLEGDALEILPGLSEKFDFIFMDAAKGQYIQFLPYCIKMLNKGGILIADDILKDGYVALEKPQVPKRQRTTHKRMRDFLNTVKNADNLESSILAIDDGILFCTKKED